MKPKYKVNENRPDLEIWFVNKEDCNYGIKSRKSVQLKCPDCGYEFEEKISNFAKRVKLCPKCNLDGISRPNKFLRAFLEEIKDQLQQKNFEWNPTWGE